MCELRQPVRYCTCGHIYWLLNCIWNFSQLLKCASSTTHSLSTNMSVKMYLDHYFQWAVVWPQLSTKSSHLISIVCESMWKVWCAIRMWKHDMHCSVAVCCNHLKDSPIELMLAIHLVHRCLGLCWNIPEFVFEQQVLDSIAEDFFLAPCLWG